VSEQCVTSGDGGSEVPTGRGAVAVGFCSLEGSERPVVQGLDLLAADGNSD
jgi:hypothetical protein